MSEPFRLTMWEPRPEPRRPYQIQPGDGAPWHGMTARGLHDWLERFATYPDELRARIDAGETVRVTSGFLHGPHYLRRADAGPDRRQLALL